LLVAPALVDWSEYRAVFAGQLGAATGRSVSIDGDIDFTILPRPAFNAGEVRFSGAIADDFVAVENLSARLAFAPLLRGRFQVRELILRKPEARVTRTSSGVIDFPLPVAVESAGAPEKPVPAQTSSFILAVERVEIEGGAFSFQDTVNASEISGQGVDLVFVAKANGPLTLSGALTVDGTPLTVEASAGRSGVGGVRAVSATVGLSEAEATITFTGSVTQELALRGDLNVSGASSGAVLASFGLAGTSLPQAMLTPFALTAKINGNGKAVTFDQVVVDLGGTAAKGAVTWQAGASPHMDVRFEFAAVPVEAWRFSEAHVTPRTTRYAALMSAAHAQEASEAQAADSLFAPFKNLSAAIDVRVPILSYRGETLRDGFFVAALADGELKISDISVTLPGATRAKAFGSIRIGPDAMFDGALEISAGNLRSVLTWLGVDVAAVPSGRLTNASLRAAVQGTPTRLSLGDVTAVVDTTSVNGRIMLGHLPRPTLSVDLAVGAVNIDSYLSNTAARPRAATASTATPPAEKSSGYGVTPQFATFSGLADVDAEIALQVKELTAGGIANGRVGLDLGLKDGTLKIRSAALDGVAGATVWASGAVSGFGGVLRFEEVQLDLSASDLGRLGRVFGYDVSPSLRALAPVSLTGVIGGGLAQTDVTLTLKAGGATIHGHGQALALEQQPRFVFDVEATHGSYGALMRAVNPMWPTRAVDPGVAKITAHITHERSETKIESIVARIGDAALDGTLSLVDMHGAPQVTGELTGITVNADKLWPRDPTRRFAAAAPRDPVKLIATAKPEAWSAEPFDWWFLHGWTGNVKLSGPLLVMRGLQAQDFSTRLIVADGAAEISEWMGKAFGGAAQVSLRMAAAPVPDVKGQVTITGGDLGAVTAALNGGASGLKPGAGKIDFNGNFNARGAAPSDLVAALSGAATVKITATESGAGVVAGLLAAVTAANQAEGIGAKPSPVTVDARLSAANGQIKIENAAVSSRSYGGNFTGVIDLPGWQVDLAGRLRMERRGAGDQRASAVPITVKGALDLPNIMLMPVR